MPDPTPASRQEDDDEMRALLAILQEQFDRAIIRPTLPTWPELHELEREHRIRRVYG